MIHNSEQETVIQFDPIDDVVHLFSSMPYIVRKYRKLAEKNGFDITRDDTDVIEIDIPKDRFSFGVKAIRSCTISEEQKAKNREFLLELNRKRREEKLAASGQDA